MLHCFEMCRPIPNNPRLHAVQRCGHDMVRAGLKQQVCNAVRILACEEWCKTVVMEVKHDVSRWWLATNDVKLISPKQVPKLSSYKNLSFQKKRLFFMMIIPLGSQRRGNRKKLIRLGVVKQCLAHMWILEPAYTCEHACQTLTTKLAIVTLSASLKAWCCWML